MTEASGRPVDQKLAWVYLKRLGFSLQRPLRRHAKADMEAQEAFKKGGSPAVFETSFENTPRRKSRSGRRTKGASD